VHVFVSDAHFGRSDPGSEREVERDLVTFLRSIRDEVESLFLLGDMFEYFIEYRHSIPKGFIRFMGLLAEWTDSGIPIKYLAGNHDPWHRDFFQNELGVTVIQTDSTEQLSGLRVYLTHGDGLGAGTVRYNLMKPLLRHPLPVGLFTSVLPSDAGLGLAKWYSRTFGKTTVNMKRVEALREAARTLLNEKDADLVVMGHSHHPEATRWDARTYINLGAWYHDRTAAIIENGTAKLVRWDGQRLVPFEREKDGR
jgi:UDP-2,3-diacylglucosamine hydrolase